MIVDEKRQRELQERERLIEKERFYEWVLSNQEHLEKLLLDFINAITDFTLDENVNREEQKRRIESFGNLPKRPDGSLDEKAFWSADAYWKKLRKNKDEMFERMSWMPNKFIEIYMKKMELPAVKHFIKLYETPDDFVPRAGSGMDMNEEYKKHIEELSK